MFDNRTFKGLRFDVERHVVVEDDRSPADRLPSIDHPWTTGTSGVGVVDTIGSNVTRFTPGDRVFGLMDIRQS